MTQKFTAEEVLSAMDEENVKKAMGRIDRYLAGWRICQTPWQIIRTRLIELEALLADYENANKHSADDCVAKDAEITRLQSRLAAANALYADTLRKPASPMQVDIYPLPDSLYPQSKDWMEADYAGRVEWLHSMYENRKEELDCFLAAQEQGECELRALEAVMETVDPATWPGLTAKQRCALGRFAKPVTGNPAPPASPAGVLDGWADAYAAFKGAFDTPAAWLKDNSEYANDARKRLREFNEAMKAQQPTQSTGE